MLTAKIKCTQCNRPLTKQSFETYKELAFGMQALIVACHAAMPHCNHQLEFKVEGDPEYPDAHELEITCQAVGCRTKKISQKSTVPIELVGAMLLIFHTGHEGHPLEVTYNGERWETKPV